MYQFEAEKSPRFAGENHVLVATVFLLTGVGLVTLYSASYAFASRFFRDGGLHFISGQLKAAGVGMALFFLASRVNLDVLRKLIKLLVVFAIILCALTFVPGIGDTRNGVSRWIKLPGGRTFQPSEIVKLVLPLYLAHILDKKQDGLDKFSTGILPPVLITALFFILIHLQNNLSTALFIALNALVVFFLAGLKLRYFFSAVVMILPLAGLLILAREHRLRRLISLIKPEWDPLGAGYQVASSVRTIISGGLWGKGLGRGTRKIASIPEVYSDFVFASFAEESGFLGVVFVFVLFGVFACLAYRGALRARDTFRRLLAFSLVTTIVSQALVNVAIVSGSLPVAGYTLPFFSAGGSSLVVTLLMAGLVVNVCRSRTDYRPQDVFNTGAAGEGVYAG
ncbi:MAG: putative lipid II flippase FtsW [Treponema sp.]|jgi:cell division protein FtsW|nr:putative lipid II flippase FtsW [Treponema sp.]